MPFSGLAIYNTGVFDGIAEDVSPMISQISPFETPLLDRLSQPESSAQNVLHEWLEEELCPNTVVSSTSVDTQGTALSVHVGGTAMAAFLSVGAVIKNKTTGEYLQVAAIAGNTLTVTRGFGGSTVASLNAGHSLFIVSDAALEGADVSGDRSRPRSRRTNYCQIFKKDVVVSGTTSSVNMLGGISNEFEHQKAQRLKESIRDLEKACIQGKISGNTIGSGTAYRTMRGIWDSLTTNVTSTGTLTPLILDNIIRGAWDNGGTDVDMVLLDPNWKGLTDSWQDSRVHVYNADMGLYKRSVKRFESSFADVDLVLCRWMPANSALVLSSGRVKVVPLNGRSYQFVPVARTGDSEKGMIIGEYTLEVKNEEGMAKAFG